ncbi:TPA: hypothetical protein WI656_002138 [Neisseria meningitidis]|uniref:hypothetical protein n=1 Tax=Neisseria meningitidis TaxID=487 RepID=UPI0002D85B16|nr:hypothetical protein [Neisseria meningitidis]MBH2050498.1 hypothetical protein [Neisseria meningitidis]MBH2083951.1 hypothetical protein [Neisseria meningitidis]MBH2251605.1 hypothetical protein [Neisseria meningitidis]MBH5799102.1 hypothetical protein [Neisseria meningitidis]MBH5889796.1 hypothetical protein [Neisseria meningitidis]
MFAVIFFSTLGCILAWIRDIPKIKSKKILARSLYVIGIINVIISYVLIKNILVSVSDGGGIKYVAIYLSNLFFWTVLMYVLVKRLSKKPS